jgi:putative glutamine amidotransferase
MKLYSALYADFYPLEVFFPDAIKKVVDVPTDLDGPGILILHGGADISPSLYGQTVSAHTYAGARPSRRDEMELALLKEAQKQNIFVFGICRGAQLMCAAAGGTLVQDVTNHSDNHLVHTSIGSTFKVNSIHHQMQNPFKVDHELLAWSKTPRSSHYIDDSGSIEMPCEPEAVFYPGMGLGVQWHPEMMDSSADATKWIMKYVDNRA